MRKGKSEKIRKTTGKRAIRAFSKAGVFLRSLVTNNLSIKILSVLFAILLWGYIVTETNPETIKVFRNVPVRIVGETALHESGFATTIPPSELIPDGITVRAGIGIKEYSSVSAIHVDASLDLSQVNHLGTNRINITVQSVNPALKIKSYSREYIDVNVEKYVNKNIHVGVEFENELPKNIWRGEAEVYPDIVSLSGPESVINSIAEASVIIDQSKLKRSLNGDTYPLSFYTASGQDVATKNITVSSLVGVRMSVKHKKVVLFDVTNSILNADKLQEGYEIVDISYVYPGENNMITLLGSEDALDKIGEQVRSNPIDLNGLSSSLLSVKRKLILPDNIEALDGSEVLISV
ncbi:MAG TPA: hypothetical protein PLZ84_04975, partial [Clostridia bacterium]|nr:hypothetical protein [Clostridia bacterium]